MIALDASYHGRCLAELYNKVKSLDKSDIQSTHDEIQQGIAFAELIMYIEDVRECTEAAPVLKLTDLIEMYSTRLSQLGVSTTARIHSTKLKDRILGHFTDMKAYQEGRNIFLAFNRDVGHVIKTMFSQKYDEESILLAKAANIVRRDMLNMRTSFNGAFNQGCQQEAIPQSLLALVSMILSGPTIKEQTESDIHQIALSIAQLLQFNSSHKRSDGTGVRHTSQREPPLPVYLGLKIHAKTRTRELIDTLYELGLSISYDRVLRISSEIGNSVCDLYSRENVVCPPGLRSELFTTAAVDNIDHNSSSSTAVGTFHGTGISLFQHREQLDDGIAQDRNYIETTKRESKKIIPLPDFYTNVPAVIQKVGGVLPPKSDARTHDDTADINTVIEEEIRWLESTEENYLHDVSADSNLSWSAFHASRQEPLESPPCLSALLPLFPDDSKSVAMICHSMNVIRHAVLHLNADQIPVITFDQPLYAIAKRIQWKWPNEFGEDKFVILLGGLHIEMAALKVVGDWLEGSGWVEALVQAKVASAGTADSFLKAAHLTRTRHAHQVSASSLYILLRKAYDVYVQDLSHVNSAVAFEGWCDERSKNAPHFQYWFNVLKLELTILSFVRSLRQRNFSLYLASITELIPWFFAMDHCNYARWMPIHLRDMTTLGENHPQVDAEFRKGNFTVSKTKKPFSSISIDHAHEQNNAAVKGDGGAISLMLDPEALRRWMVAGPEISRIISEFECSQSSKSIPNKHHEQTMSVQAKFAEHIQSCTATFEEMGNPFLEESSDLLKLDTREIMDASVLTCVRKVHILGQGQFNDFVAERLVDQTRPFTDPIKRNKLAPFRISTSRDVSTTKSKISTLKGDCSLFSRLYIACQTRDGNLSEFFKHENQACPPSLSQQGQLRQGKKSDLLQSLEKLAESQSKVSDCDVMILDGAVVVNMIPPRDVKTFGDYSRSVFLPYIENQLQNVRRVDIVWDEYRENSLKSQTRVKRGKGVRRRVAFHTALPGNWEQFLRLDDNKKELFAFLASEIEAMLSDKAIITTKGMDVVCFPQRDTTGLAPCNHEEADTRMMLHVADAVQQGLHKIIVRTVDTDVVMLAVSVVPQFTDIQLWVAFGTAKHFRYIPAHEISAALGTIKSKALPMFHAYTGCDTVSAFGTVGKKKAFDVWTAFNDATTAFYDLSEMPQILNNDCINILERFTILLYDRTSSLQAVDEARKQLFTQKGRSIDAIPPTKAALIEHIRRAVLQGGYCWGQVCKPYMEIPSPSAWGWTNPIQWKPFWTTLPEAGHSCRELLRCGCKVGCRGHCKCRKANLKCTALCCCGGDCINET